MEKKFKNKNSFYEFQIYDLAIIEKTTYKFEMTKFKSMETWMPVKLHSWTDFTKNFNKKLIYSDKFKSKEQN